MDKIKLQTYFLYSTAKKFVLGTAKIPLKYDCTWGNCKNYTNGAKSTYGDMIHVLSEDLEKACTKDYPKCKAYEYSAAHGKGSLCTTFLNDRSRFHILGDRICVQSLGKTSLKHL